MLIISKRAVYVDNIIFKRIIYNNNNKTGYDHTNHQYIRGIYIKLSWALDNGL